MNKLYKIFCVCIAIIIVTTSSYAKYSYNSSIDVFALSRDISEIVYSISKSTNEYTNADVVVEISSNKLIEAVEGFELSEDGKKLTKTYGENTTENIILEDISGNRKNVNVEVNNIDKIPPVIDGVEDGATYNKTMKPTYSDNVGIRSIVANKYGTTLSFSCYREYTDTSNYKGIDISKNTIHAEITNKPVGTVKYKYYINNSLKQETVDTEYTFTGLNKGTNYTIKIEAIDQNGNVLKTATKQIKTGYFVSMSATKEGGTFTATVYGLEPEVDHVSITKFAASDRNNIKYSSANIKSDRSVSSSLVATSITNTIETGYYYLQFHLKNASDQTIDIVGCNIIFGTNYVKPTSDVDPENITQNGIYEIIVTDLAGNITSKSFTIQK